MAEGPVSNIVEKQKSRESEDAVDGLDYKGLKAQDVKSRIAYPGEKQGETDATQGMGQQGSTGPNSNGAQPPASPPGSSTAASRAGGARSVPSAIGAVQRATMENVAAAYRLSGNALGDDADDHEDDEEEDSEDTSSLRVPDRLKFEIGDEEEEEDGKSSEVVEKKDDEAGKDAKSSLFNEFEEWLVEHGAQFPELYLKRYTGDVRGVHAKRRVGPYVCLVQIPLKCLITDHMGRTETEMGRKLFASNYALSTPNLIAVIVYILTTREDPNHFFQPYYRILPKDYTNFPIFYNEEQLSWLEGSPLLEDIAERKRNMRADYDEVCRVCPEFMRFSFEDFLEVRTAVGSRNFGIVVHGQKRTAMVPYADMLNHYRPRETSWTFEDSKDSFTITSLSALHAGQQVMDSYGKKCNSKFLLHYGFAVECNREEDGKCQNEIYLRLALPSAERDPLLERRLAVLGPSRTSRAFRLSMNIEDKATSEALSYARVAAATEAELDALLAESASSASSAAAAGDAEQYRRGYRDSFRDSPVSFISTANEIAALEFLATACQRQLDGYPSTYEENLAQLSDSTIKPFSVRRTTLIVILGEQEICKFWIDACETISRVVEETEDVPLHMALRSLPRGTPKEADLSRYAARLAYKVRMASN